MSETGTGDGAPSEPRDLPGWKESLSLKMEDMAQRAAALTEEWNGQFGAEAFQNPHFVKAYLSLIRGHSILGVFKTVHARDRVEEELSASIFESRFERTAEAVGQAVSAPDPVALGFFHYLGLLLEEARTLKGEDLLGYPEPIQQILTFGRQLKENPALGGFRIDIHLPGPSPADPGIPELPELPKGYHLGKVDIVRRIAVGGFAQVYQVYHPGLKEHRAAKLFMKHNLLGELGQLLKAFYAEAQLQNALKNPNIVRVLDVDDHLGYLVLFMEYVDGRNLRSLIEERRSAHSHLSPSEILEIVIPVAKGLEYAHAHQILHRDLKPENILIAQDGSVKITDFGLAKTLNATGQRRTTRLGILVGTAHYMAPEQIFGDTYDFRIDLYALGAVIYHMAWGEPLFDIKDTWKILELQRDKKPRPLSQAIEGFPKELSRIVMKLLEKKPEDRYASATELIQALESCRAGLSAPGASTQRRRLRRGAALRVLALFLIAAIPGYFGISAWLRPNETRHAFPADPLEQTVQAKQSPPELPPAAAPGSEEVRMAAPAAKILSPTSLEGAEPKAPPPTPKSPEIRPPAIPLREQLRTIPVSADESLFTLKILDIFSKHHGELLERGYDAIGKELGALRPERISEYTTTQIEAARDIVQLAKELVQGRWKEIAESKGQIRLSLTDGGMAEGAVDHVGDRAITLTDPQGGKTDIQFTKIAPEAWIQGKTIPVALVAYQALSGDAVKALDLALKLEKDNEKIALWFPVLVRLARLRASDLVKTAILEAEAPLSRQEKKVKFLKGLPHYLPAAAALHALSDVEVEISGIYPSLEREFKEAKREGEALELLLDGAPSRVLSNYAGTEAYPIAGTLVLAGFIAEIEGAHNDLMGDAGWLKYDWELRPDELKLEDRLQFWDRLHGEGCFIRDPKGPRSLIMGRPHPRTGEGLMIVYQFEPMGEDRDNAEWRLNLRREGGGNTYLRFAPGSISLRTFGLDSAVKPETLDSVTVPRDPAEPRFHTCVLIPGEKLQVYLDGTIVACLTKEDTILPSQLSLVVVHGKLSVESILAMKKPAK
jgi:serine/threonine protein kinase